MFEFHYHSVNTCLKHLKSSAEKGISMTEAQKRQTKYGLNKLPEEKPLSQIKIFFSQFNSALIYILIIAGVLSFLLHEYVDSIVIAVAIIINVSIGFIQESKANNAISKLKKLVEHKAFVIRDGQEYYIDSSQLTLGDIILIKSGNRIPADARLLEANDLQINESSLTGESLPTKKQSEKILAGASLGDRTNMVFASTVVVSGLGRAMVTAIGGNTEIGQIAELVKQTEEEKTPLQLRLDKFSRQLGLLFVIICLLIIFAGILQKREIFEVIETAVAVGVASIPEGLTVAVTFILALGMQKILQKKALTRKLIAAETLGSTTVICSDKTGTLTEGKMHVAHIVIGEKEFELNTEGSRQDREEAKLTELALQVGMMCNNAVIENPNDELAAWRIVGNPTDVALLSAAIQAGLRKEKILEKEKLIDELPFSSESKFMISLHQKSPSQFILYEKGAPENILKKCKFFYHHGKIHRLDEKEKNNLLATQEKMTSKGLRVIGLAIKEKKSDSQLVAKNINWESLDNDLTFVGMMAIKDPLRPEAKETIHICREAGIRPVIITGDHKLTAKAIAREIGLKISNENIMTGEELEKISDEKLYKIVKKIELYARVSPHHKLRIVKALQQRGEVVAMTGDGINDSPALKAADIGICLGTGTDIAKESSDIVLLDDNFKTIVAAIEQGRIIFKNIRKMITYLLSDSFSEVIIIIGSILFNTPLAILPTQILWINIINDGLPNFSLAFESDHGVSMKEKPLQKNEALLTKEMKIIIFGIAIVRDVLIFLLFFYLLGFWEIGKLRTFIFALLGVKSLLSIFSLRSFHVPIWKINPFSNIKIFYSVFISLLLLIVAIEWAPLQKLLSTESLDKNIWLMIILISSMNIFAIEITKAFFARNLKLNHT